MSDRFSHNGYLALLNSDNPYKNAQALSLLMSDGDFADEFVALASDIAKKDGSVAFHVPVAAVANAFLALAGKRNVDTLDEASLYVLHAHEMGRDNG